MTKSNKSIRQMFVERLAKVGVILINNQADSGVVNADLETLGALTDAQFAELDAAIADIEQAARVDERSMFREVAAPGADDPVPSADQFVEWLRDSVGHPLRVTADAVNLYVDAIRDQGREIQRRAGLNDAGDLPTLDLADVNAVEIGISTAHVVIDVDSRRRVTLNLPNRVIVTDPIGNRYVVLRDGETLETVPVSDAG